MLCIEYTNYIHMISVNNADQMPQTTIRIQTATRDRLVDLGKKNESYDTIINKLVDFYENRRTEEKG